MAHLTHRRQHKKLERKRAVERVSRPMFVIRYVPSRQYKGELLEQLQKILSGPCLLPNEYKLEIIRRDINIKER
jgi:hypothetical protein